MGYLLLWLESLTCSSLFIGLAVACAARLNGRLWQLAVATLAILLLLGKYAALATFVGVVEIHYRVNAGWLWPAATLGLAFLVGAVWLAARGLMRAMPDDRPVAACWPRGKLALALAAAVMLHAMTFFSLDANARQSLATVRAEAMALATSVAPPRMPDHENAAVIYQQAFEAFGPYAGGTGEFWPPIWQEGTDALTSHEEPKVDLRHIRVGQPAQDTDEASPPEPAFDFKSPALGEFLAEHAGELALVRAAAARSGCFFDRDYARPTFDMLLPEIQGLSVAGRLLALHARWSAAQGDLKGALVDVGAMYGVARHAGAEPILVSFLVSAMIDEMADTTLEAILSGQHPTLEDLSPVQIEGGVSHRRMFVRAMRMEEAFLLNSIANLESADISAMGALTSGHSPLFVAGLGALYRVFYLADDIAACRATMHDYQRLPSLTYKNYHEDALELESTILRSPKGIVTSLFLPSLGPSAEVAFRADAQQRLAQTAKAMHQYYAQHGAFPDSLLAPNFLQLVPRDPYNNKPIQLKKTATGWTLYCVGPNMIDEGGEKTDRSTAVIRQGDLTFQYAEPEPKQ